MFMISKALLLQITILLTVVQANSDTITLTTTPVLPEMGHKVTISCNSTQKTRTLFHKGEFITGCNNKACMPDNHPEKGYTYTADDEKAEVTISSLNRTRDQGQWTCSASVNQSLCLHVYSFPRRLLLSSEGETEADLAKSNVTLQCQTDGCSYTPPHNITWFCKYLKSATECRSSEPANIATIEGNCTNPEKIYTSTITLPLYMTMPDNSDETLTFSCGIQYTDHSRNVQSSESKKIRLAVLVSKIELQINSQPVSDNSSIEVMSGSVVAMNCIPGTSRPDPIIEWYIGFQRRSYSTNQTYIFTPGNEDHDKVIYCRAYNIQINKAVESSKPRLYVKAHVTEVQLQLNGELLSDNSSLYVISNEPVDMNCIPGTSRPDPIIEWHIGLQMRSSSTNHTYRFTPGNVDHDQLIYCRAYSVQPNKAVESSKPKLYVKVIVTSVNVSLLTSKDVFYEGCPKALTCTSSPTRPKPSIRWFIDSRQLTDNISITNTKDLTGLYIMTSQIFLTLTRDNMNQNIYCDGFIANQLAVSSSRYNVTVWYAPDVAVNLSGSTLQNKTTVLVCEARGVPFNNTFFPWVHMWQKDVIRNELHGVNNSTHSVLELDSQFLENIGTYICSATNGVSNVKGTTVQRGSKHLNFTGVPTILCKTCIFAGEIGQSVNISIPFYSDPAIESIQIHNNSMLVTKTSNNNIYLSHKEIIYHMYNKTVHLEAQVAHFDIENLSTFDFDNYTLALNNNVGHIVFTFQLIPVGPPLKVKRFYLNALLDGLVELHFDPGFSGGSDQTFNIEYTCVRQNNVWQNTSVTNLLERNSPYKLENGTFSVKVNVKTLPPGICLYRIYSCNVNGNSPYSDNITVFISSGIETSDNGARYTLSVGIVAVVLASAVIAGLIICQKRKCDKKKASVDQSQHIELLNRRGQVCVGNDNAYQYSIYENVLRLQRDDDAVHFDDANVYENGGDQERNLLKSVGSLIYADLELENPKTSNGKPIIHGLENRTAYAEIVFSRLGPPVPDSDDK